MSLISILSFPCVVSSLQLFLLLAPWYLLICFYLFAINYPSVHLSCHLSTSLLSYSLIISGFTYTSSSPIYIYPSLCSPSPCTSIDSSYLRGTLSLCFHTQKSRAQSISVPTDGSGTLAVQVFTRTVMNWPIKAQDSQYKCIFTTSCPLQRTGPGMTLGHHKYQNNVYNSLPSPRESFYDGNSKSFPNHQLLYFEWGCWEPIHLLAIKASSSLMSKVFKASAPSFTHPPTPYLPCAGRSSILRCLLSFSRWPHFNQLRLFSLSFLRWPHLKQTRLFSLSFIPSRTGRIQTNSTLQSFLPSCAGRIFDLRRRFQSNSMSSCRLHNGEPLSSHRYPRAFDENFHGKPFRIYTGKRGLYSYKAAQISASLIRYTEQLRDLDHELDPKLKGMHNQKKRQIQALKQWKFLELREYEFSSTKELLDFYSRCFDDLFFGGVLRGFYGFLFVDPEAIPDAYGTCGFHGPFEHGFEIEITLSNRRGNECFESLDEPSQLRKYLGTLLHEMTHAVFQLYCCHTCVSCKGGPDMELGNQGTVCLGKS